MRLEDFQPFLDRFADLDRRLADGSLPPNHPDYPRAIRERGRLERIVQKVDAYRRAAGRVEQAQGLLADPEMAAMAKEEAGSAEAERVRLQTELEDYLLTNQGPVPGAVIMEIRPGTGGEEASLFAGELLTMYCGYAKRRGWKVEVMDVSPSDLGGVKSATLTVEGEEAARRLAFESGSHRVQRVPETEASGRIHTSVATVAVLPEFEDVAVDIQRDDLRIDTYSAGGPGGQHVNKTASAVRLTHLPTGIVVACQVERSQHRNRDLAMRWLKARLLEHYRTQQKQEVDSMRRSQIGTGDRAEKIRTYNFPQSRVTDHRITFSVFNLAAFLAGDLDEMVDALLAADRAERLKQRAKRSGTPS